MTRTKVVLLSLALFLGLAAALSAAPADPSRLPSNDAAFFASLQGAAPQCGLAPTSRRSERAPRVAR